MSKVLKLYLEKDRLIMEKLYAKLGTEIVAQAIRDLAKAKYENETTLKNVKCKDSKAKRLNNKTIVECTKFLNSETAYLYGDVDSSVLFSMVDKLVNDSLLECREST